MKGGKFANLMLQVSENDNYYKSANIFAGTGHLLFPPKDIYHTGLLSRVLTFPLKELG